MIGGSAWVLVLVQTGYLVWNWPIRIMLGGALLGLFCASLGLISRRYGWWVMASLITLLLYTLLLLGKRVVLVPGEVVLVGAVLWLSLELAGIWCTLPTERFASSALWSLTRSLGWRLLVNVGAIGGLLLLVWVSAGWGEGGSWVFLLQVGSSLVVVLGICALLYQKASQHH